GQLAPYAILALFSPITHAFSVVLNVFSSNLLLPLMEQFPYCAKMYSLWGNSVFGEEVQRRLKRDWDVLESRVERNFQRDSFYVQVFNWSGIRDSASLDVSLLSPDCIHLSSRSLSLLHMDVWNRLVQGVSAL